MAKTQVSLITLSQTTTLNQIGKMILDIQGDSNEYCSNPIVQMWGSLTLTDKLIHFDTEVRYNELSGIIEQNFLSAAFSFYAA